MDATTEKLVDYTLSTRYEDLAPEVVGAAKDRILDTLGCVAAAYGHPTSETVRRFASRYSMDRPATILGSGQSAAPEMAAFANGVMLRLTDMSDTYRNKSGGHPSDIMSAALAAAELAGADGKALITAIATGYEIYCGCCDAIDLNSLGWDQPVYGVVASALAAGKLLGLDRAQLGNAVALALVPNMAMYQTRQGELSVWKGCAGANAARNGLFAALLAEAGITGPEEPIEGKCALWDVVGEFDWPLEPGEPPYRIAHTNLKCFPVCYHGQTAVWTALGLRDRIRVEDVETIEVGTYGTAVRMMASDPTRWAPSTHETADHSLPYVVGTALLDGTVDDKAFHDDALRAPAIGALMKRISVVEDSDLTALDPESSPCRITVRLTDGREVRNELRYPKGHDKNPMTGEEVQRKFKGLFTAYGEAAQADAVIAAVDGLDRAKDVKGLIQAFARSKA
jgi:2-methylcitrate dehydratase